jgi:hypothetical protein
MGHNSSKWKFRAQHFLKRKFSMKMGVRNMNGSCYSCYLKVAQGEKNRARISFKKEILRALVRKIFWQEIC